jgi:exopolysaccharide biosynthesis polyprenyl glycosylphosphotransferase
MKKFEVILTVLQLPVDYLFLVAAGLTAYSLRFTDTALSIRPVIFNLTWQHYWPLVMVVALFWLIIFAITGLYAIDPNRKMSRDIGRVVLACFAGFSGITIYTFFSLQRFDSRFLVLSGTAIAILYIIIGRLLIRGLKALLYRAGIGLRRVVIIGNHTVAETLKTIFTQEPRWGYTIVGELAHFPSEKTTDLLKFAPDEILFTDPKAHQEEVIKTIEFATTHHLTFKYSADLFDTLSTNMAIATVAGIPIVELRRTRLFGWGGVAKRIADVLGSLILIVICSPIYLIAILIILVESGRPVIYKNERVGYTGKNFTAFKFRSMYQKYCTGPQFGKAGQEALKKEAELIKRQSIKSGPIYKIKDDPRTTPFGRFIRRLSIDELPQLLNVLKGDMSLVGPRPHQPREVERYDERYKIVFDLKPGLTGLAQISGRSNLSFEEEMRLDTFYIENWSLFMDIIIILKTPFVVLKKDGAVT